MLSLASWLAAGHLLTSPLHPIDFQLAPGTQLKPSTPGEMPSVVNPGEPVETYALPRYSIAHGFGNGVPLSFAAKQMVPSSFRVIFRNAAYEDLIVSWSGGRPWNQTLRATLRQLGLRMVLVGRTVTIG